MIDRRNYQLAIPELVNSLFHPLSSYFDLLVRRNVAKSLMNTIELETSGKFASFRAQRESRKREKGRRLGVAINYLNVAQRRE